MLGELAVSTLMVLLTVFIHGAGLLLLTRLLRTEAAEEKKDRIPAASLRALGFMMLLTLGLMVLHGLEIWAYAALYQGIGALPDLRTAVYFSTITYGTIGFDNEGFAEGWELVAAIEGVNGAILIGWSIAFLVSAMGRLGRH